MNRSKTLPMTIVTVACLALSGGAIVLAEMPGVPPPSDEVLEIAIPKHLVRAFQVQVYPSYLTWLQNGDGAGDSLAAFELYLSNQPISRSDRWMFVMLYIRFQ